MFTGILLFDLSINKRSNENYFDKTDFRLKIIWIMSFPGRILFWPK